MKEKTTSGSTDINSGLNEGNPNTLSTPVGNDRIRTGLVGGMAQSNHEDDKKGAVPPDTKKVHRGETEEGR